MKADLYQEVTDRIIAELEADMVPWVRPWKGLTNARVHNALAGRPYNGVNFLLLWIAADKAG